MPSDDELLDQLRAGLELARREPPTERVAALRDAVEAPRDRPPDREPAGRRRPWRPEHRWVRHLAVAAAAVIAVGLAVAGGRLLERSESPGVLEFSGPLMAPDGSVGGHVSVRRVDTGRVVRLASEELPLLPAGEFYEVWFVGPGDTLAAPNRISAGTFHPDGNGRSTVQLLAAVDPARYPEIVVTAEQGDGAPNADGPEVLRARIDPPSS